MTAENKEFNELSKKRYGVNLENFEKLLLNNTKITEKEPIDDDAFCSFPIPFINTTFPHSRPMSKNDPTKEREVWSCKSGPFSLLIKSGTYVHMVDGEEKQKFYGIPYGSIPRILMTFVTSEAVRTNSRTISLGRSFSGFLKRLGFSTTGGRRGDITRVKDQMKRLFKSTVCYQHTQNNIDLSGEQPLTKKLHLWWDEKNPDQMGLQESYVVLDKDFFDTIIKLKRYFPVDERSLKAIRKSPLGIDLYLFLAMKLPHLEKETYISHESLHKQFGTNYKNIKDFKKHLKTQMRKVLVAAYPKAKAHVDIGLPGRIKLTKAPPSVPYKKGEKDNEI